MKKKIHILIRRIIKNILCKKISIIWIQIGRVDWKDRNQKCLIICVRILELKIKKIHKLL